MGDDGRLHGYGGVGQMRGMALRSGGRACPAQTRNECVDGRRRGEAAC